MTSSSEQSLSPRRADRWIGTGLLLFAALLYFVIIPREVDSAGRSLGLQPSFMPNLIALFLGFTGLLLTIVNPQEQEEDENSGTSLLPLSVLITLGALFLYPFAAEWLGYLVSSAGILVFFFFFFGCRNLPLLGTLSLGIPLALYWFFSKVMLVMLPRGIFM